MNPPEIREFLAPIYDARDELALALQCAPVDADRVRRAHTSLSELAEKVHDAEHDAEWREQFEKVLRNV